MDAKTITVTHQTHRVLEDLKTQLGARSFDKLLFQLAEEKMEIKKSMFGAAKGLRQGFQRDRSDRI